MRYPLFVLCSIIAVSACADSSTEPQPSPTLTHASAGQLAFVDSCSSCHASGDGYDLAYFQFADTTIMRRALTHVDSATAHTIVSYLQSLKTRNADAVTPLLQPGDLVLSSDSAFAVNLFGRDEWPLDLTETQLLSIDPRRVSIPFRMPTWSDENSEYDWMPERPVSESLLQMDCLETRCASWDGAGIGPLHKRNAAAALVAYRLNPTLSNLTIVVEALRRADHRSDDTHVAPCPLTKSPGYDYTECFETRRWTATLVGQHFLRNGSMPMDSSFRDALWDVGNAARMSLVDGAAGVPDAARNWPAWMYLGWSYGPSDQQRNMSYLATGLANLGYSRLAVFAALRSEVARLPGSYKPYMDTRAVARASTDAWFYNSVIYGLRNLSARQARGDVPLGAQADTAKIELQTIATEAAGRVSGSRLTSVLDTIAKLKQALQ